MTTPLPTVLNNIVLTNTPKPMKSGKSKSWLGEYHWISLAVEEDPEINLDTEAKEWCETQFGKSGSRWSYQGRKFYFKDEKDMSMFILRWS